MKELIKQQFKDYILGSKDNWLRETGDRFYDAPIVKFASADDPLFEDYKTIIGKEHLTPEEAFELAFGENSYCGGTVISIALPINEKIRLSNRSQKEQPSKEWALNRAYGDEVFLKQFHGYMVELVTELGYKTMAPCASEWFKITRTPTGPVSNWSERHIAYATGLGTFSLNDGFITEKGMAVRLLSVVTELELETDIRNVESHTENCLFYRKGICGACIRRCPVGAISQLGHDKIKCRNFVYGDESRKLAVSYGGKWETGAGCGLCQTNVPCECGIPR
jgi:epoxyqueuosine reductase